MKQSISENIGKYRWHLLVALLIPFLLIMGCEEEDLSNENPAPPQDNVNMKVSLLYNGEGFTSDSLLANNQGDLFYIDSVKFLFSNYFFLKSDNPNDTLDPEMNFATVPDNGLEQIVGNLEAGDYSGKHYLVVGVDSLTSTQQPAQIEGDNTDLLEDKDYQRKDGKGYHHVQIFGRKVDFAQDTSVVPLEYRLGTHRLKDTIASNVSVNFSVIADRKLNLIVLIDVAPMLNVFSLTKPNNIVESDPNSTADFNLAKAMMDSLTIEIF